jgi:hypothetical protein
MNCARTQLHIPDLWFLDLDFHLRSEIEGHLLDCETCREWYLIWQKILYLGQERVKLPRTLNWIPFNNALDCELQNPIRSNRSYQMPIRIPPRISEIIRFAAR